ncbi:MFS transporter [Georgenia yuyongxinii]|uniref:MFS transporter n=1 Tax=Georgenia yuyongxinii TaxID=2589797 RepID=A0A552WMC8_9MICO|nr:MFS transporter [Georgenia yuyongxinii]TRW43935.1 MFS transporter [Georgenia yuyongxinii]
MTRTFYSLRYFNYRLWFVGALVANVGTWMQRVAQDWLVLTVLSDDSGFAVGIVTALQFLPVLLLSPVAGVLADRLPRRKLLIGTQAGLGVLAAGLGVMVLTETAELWHVYVFALALGVVSALDGPVRQTFVAEMVPASDLPNAVGLNSTSFNAARLIGPGLAGLLIAAVGPGWVFIINAVSFAATIFSLTLMRTRELHELPHAARGKGQVRAGLAYVRRRSDIVVIMVVVGVVGAFGLNFQLTSAVMAREAFGKGAGEYGILGSILAIGSLTGALLAARRKHPRVRLVIGAALAFGVTMGVQAFMPTYELYALLCIPVGLFSLTMMTAANTAVQMSTEPAMRGRVMSLYMMVFLGTTPIGSPVIGWVSEAWGPRWSVGVGAIASILVAVVAALWVKRSWHVRVRYQRLGRPHLVVEGPGERHAHQAERAERELAKATLAKDEAQQGSETA